MVVALLYNGTWLLGKLENIFCYDEEGNWISFNHILQLYAEALLCNLTFEGFIWFALLSKWFWCVLCRFWWSDKIWGQIANYGPQIVCFYSFILDHFLAQRWYTICCLSNYNHQVFNRISSNSWQVCSQEIIHHLTLCAKKSQKLQFAPWNANRQQKKNNNQFSSQLHFISH